MADQQVPVTRTVITPQAYARAVVTAWPAVGEGIPTKEEVAVLYAQWMMETGGASCWNWNIGNAKWSRGCGYDYMCLNGVWEGVIPSVGAALVASGRAIRDPSPDHAKAVGPGKVSIIFPPPQVESRFRAFPDLSTGMVAHLKLLHERFAKAWPGVLGGDAVGTAHLLGALHYFTASADVYGGGMKRFAENFMRTSAYELAVDEVSELRGAETLPELHSDDDTPLPMIVTPLMGQEHAASVPTIFPRMLCEDDPDDDVA